MNRTASFRRKFFITAGLAAVSLSVNSAQAVDWGDLGKPATGYRHEIFGGTSMLMKYTGGGGGFIFTLGTGYFYHVLQAVQLGAQFKIAAGSGGVTTTATALFGGAINYPFRPIGTGFFFRPMFGFESAGGTRFAFDAQLGGRYMISQDFGYSPYLALGVRGGNFNMEAYLVNFTFLFNH